MRKLLALLSEPMLAVLAMLRRFCSLMSWAAGGVLCPLEGLFGEVLRTASQTPTQDARDRRARGRPGPGPGDKTGRFADDGGAAPAFFSVA